QKPVRLIQDNSDAVARPDRFRRSPPKCYAGTFPELDSMCCDPDAHYRGFGFPDLETPFPRVDLASPHREMPFPHLDFAFPDLEMPFPRVDLASPYRDMAFPHLDFGFPDLEMPFPRVDLAFPHREMPFPHLDFAFPDLETPFPRVDLAFPHREMPFPSVRPNPALGAVTERAIPRPASRFTEGWTTANDRSVPFR